MINKIQQSVQSGTSKFIKTVTMLSAFTILITLNAIANPTSAAVQKEIAEIFKKNPDKEIIVKVESEQKNTENVAKFESLGNGPDQDPYDQIKGYVEPQDMDYFNQLRAYQETKDENEKIKCKAVIYAILQDTVLTQEQKEILALAQFDRLTKMPGSDYRFSKKNSALVSTDPIYKERANRYGAYKGHLEILDLDAEIEKLQAEGKQLDEQEKSLDSDIQYLHQQNNLLKTLLSGYIPNE